MQKETVSVGFEYNIVSFNTNIRPIIDSEFINWTYLNRKEPYPFWCEPGDHDAIDMAHFNLNTSNFLLAGVSFHSNSKSIGYSTYQFEPNIILPIGVCIYVCMRDLYLYCVYTAIY